MHKAKLMCDFASLEVGDDLKANFVCAISWGFLSSSLWHHLPSFLL